MLQMASVYGVQQTAKQAPAFMLPHVAEVSRWLSFRPLAAYYLLQYIHHRVLFFRKLLTHAEALQQGPKVLILQYLVFAD